MARTADTIYFWINLDGTEGPIWGRDPPLALGVVDDMWFNRITDFGLPGPDRDFVNEMRTTRAIMMGRSFLQENDPKPVVAKMPPRMDEVSSPSGPAGDGSGYNAGSS